MRFIYSGSKKVVPVLRQFIVSTFLTHFHPAVHF